MKPSRQLANQPTNQPATALHILAVYFLLTLLLTYPLVFNLATAVPNDIGDPLLNTWILVWVDHALLTDPLNLFNANIFYPLPNTLAYSEHLFSTALIALPIQLLTNEPVVTYNLSLLLTFPLAAFGMYLLLLRWTRRRGAAFIAGLIFAFAPYRFAAIAHLQLLTFQWLPYALLFLDMTFTPPRPNYPANQPTYQLTSQPPNLPSVATNHHSPPPSRPLAPRPARSPAYYYLALTFLLLLQILASWYLALYTILIFGLYLLLALLLRRINRSSLPFLISTFLISLLLILPFVLPYLQLLDPLRQARPLSLALSLAAVPTDYAAAAPSNRLFGPLTTLFRSRPGFTEENTLFLGLTAPVLTLIALSYYILRIAYSVQKSRSPLPAPRSPQHASRSTSSILPIIVLFATTLLAILLTFPTPYALLVSLFPPGTIIRVPPRWIIPALFALAALAAFGYLILNSKFKIQNSKLPLLIVTLVLLAESLSIPLPLARVEPRQTLNPAYHWLADQAEPFALLELPLHSAPALEFPEVKRLYASTLGWWPLVNGYSGYTPPRQPLLAQALADFPGQEAITALQALVPTSIPYGAPPKPLLLLVHPGETPFDRGRWETIDRWQAERNPALYPLGQFEGDYLYQLRAVDPRQITTSPLAAFGENREIRLIAISRDAAPPADSLEPNPEQQFSSLTTQLALYWQTTRPLAVNYTVFIHLRAADGFVRGQADGPPVAGHYPTTAWPPGELIQDIHPLPTIDISQADHLAIGLYDPVTGQRLSAFGPAGQRLPDEAVIIPLPRP